MAGRTAARDLGGRGGDLHGGARHAGAAGGGIVGRTDCLSCSADPPVERDDRIEIVLPDGTAVRVPETVGTAALRRVLSALRG
jgi:hypothetical protein